MVFILSAVCFFLIDQTSILIPTSIHFAGLDITPFDILTAAVFMHWIGPYIFLESRHNYTNIDFNKLYLKFLLVGLIPIFIGIAMGKSNSLYAYRFFFYFVWVPVLFDFCQNRKQSMQALRILVIANFLSVLVALIMRLLSSGIQLGYVDVHYELNLIITLLLFSMIISKERLFRKPGLDVIILATCILTIIIDHSRKIYLAFLLGSTMLLIFQVFYFKNKQVVKTALVIFLSILIIVGSMGLWKNVFQRFSTIFISSEQFQTQKDVGNSGAFRIYALISGMKLIKDHPLVGVGSGDAVEIEKVILTGLGRSVSHSPHNFYISIFLYYGIPIVLWIYYKVYWFIRWSFHETIKNKTQSVKQYRAISLGMITGFTCFMFTMFFEGFGVQTVFDTWVFFGLMLGFTLMNANAVSAYNKN